MWHDTSYSNAVGAEDLHITARVMFLYMSEIFYNGTDWTLKKQANTQTNMNILYKDGVLILKLYNDGVGMTLKGNGLTPNALT